MVPVEFPEQNTVIAKGQPEYLGLPAYLGPDGHMVSCWRLSVWERIKILFTGRLWLEALTFNKPLQPLFMGVEKPFT